MACLARRGWGRFLGVAGGGDFGVSTRLPTGLDMTMFFMMQHESTRHVSPIRRFFSD